MTAFGSTVVGTTAVFFAWRQNARTLMQQRQMALDERLGARRIELYLSILEVLLAERSGGPDIDRLRALLPQVVAFASEDVQHRVKQLIDAGAVPRRGKATTQHDVELHREAAVAIIRAELLPARVQHPPAPRPRRAPR